MRTIWQVAGAAGLLLAASSWADPAAAQQGGYYDPRYERGYDRRDDGGRYDGPPPGPRNYYDDRRDRGPRGNGNGYGYGQPQGRPGYGPGPAPNRNNPMAGMSIEDQKRAIKNHREAQKKALKRGYVIP